MKIVHFTSWAPRRSGMYESVKDQIKYERREGHQSDFVSSDDGFKDSRPDLMDDGWLSPISWEKAKDAEVWVMHRNIPADLKPLFSKKVTLAVLHGPTEHMLLTEWMTEAKTTAFNLHIDMMWQYDATVVLNQHEYDIMKIYDEKDRLHYIPNSIDLEKCLNPEVPTWIYENRPAILTCDVFRMEKLPAHIIWSMPRIIEKIPTAKLNVFSMALGTVSISKTLFTRSKGWLMSKVCENIQLENNDLRPYMKGGDIGFNNNISGIASRVSMEMMAHGVPVVSYGGAYTPYTAKIWDLDSIAETIVQCWTDLSKTGSTLREDTRRYARENYDRAKEVKKYIALYETLLGKKNG